MALYWGEFYWGMAYWDDGYLPVVVTDRTQTDVDTAVRINNKRIDTGFDSLTDAEKESWFAGFKGDYNYTDFNRVGQAIQFLADELNDYGYSITVTAKQDYDESYIITLSDMINMINDVKAIKDKFYGTTVLPVTMKKLTYENANNIEKLLYEVSTYIYYMRQSFFYCGEIYGGEY